MENEIITDNKDKYHQTEDTCPFIQDPLVEHCGTMTIGEYTEQVLQGDYETPESEPESEPEPESESEPEQTKEFIKLYKLPSSKLIIKPMAQSLECSSQS